VKPDPSLLKPLPAFAGLDTDSVARVLDQARPRLVPAGSSVFEEGDEARHFYLLLDGHIRVERLNADGARVISLHIPSGQLFGIAKALGRETYPATSVAAVECLVLSWPMHLWDGFVTSYPGFASEAYRVIGRRVAEMNNRIMELATQKVEQRIACALLRLMQQHGKPGDKGVEIAFPVTRRTISEMTGSTLHTVSRLLSAWEREGIVLSRRKHIHVLDAARLESLTV